MKKGKKAALFLAFSTIGLILGILFFWATYKPEPVEPTRPAKPVIYLYPPHPMQVSVRLAYSGVLDYTYPEYKDGWSVTAYPDGTLINDADGKEYSYLFWEGHDERRYDFSRGFVVKGKDTVAFLQEKLAYMGLTPREYNELIVFWLPKMQPNAYNLITFQGSAYTDGAVLEITPKQDALLRVFMAYKPLIKRMELPPQELKPFKRRGFTVVEWGGACVE